MCDSSSLAIVTRKCRSDGAISTAVVLPTSGCCQLLPFYRTILLASKSIAIAT
ncbi:hypothetical protein [Chamaesiphon sp. OTE_75_metabat_556]|uniref:hypothetical protein n=1 Tax=Chamaesiphon sp. OTE_75_metabat_556 TaxID=2964692 RepID=UPI00286CB511|nr:hypothetical protein [Chamaesiphon sp. OTE_75_metabat_556]